MRFLIDRGTDMTIKDYCWNSAAQGWARYGAKDEKMAQRLEEAKSSIFLRRIVRIMFMRVNAKCAHQVRPPSGPDGGHRRYKACASRCRKPETLARVRRQHRDAGCVRPPVLLRPRRAGRPAGATDEPLDFGRCHAELLRGPYHFLATAAHVYVEFQLPSRAADGQLIEHSIRGAEQMIRPPHSGDCCGKVIKRWLPNREGDGSMRGCQLDHDSPQCVRCSGSD